MKKVYKIKYNKGISFCTLSKIFGIPAYEIFKQNNIHNILDLVEGQVLKIEVIENGNVSIK